MSVEALERRPINGLTAEFRSRQVSNGLKGVLVLVPGSNGDGRGMVDDAEWHVFARKYKLLLVGCMFKDQTMRGDEDYANARNGSGAALLGFLDSVKATGLPIYLWGFSAGGQFAYEFACAFPRLTGAFVANKGGVYYTALASKEAREVPGMIVLGRYDAIWRVKILQGLYALNRTFDARWRLLEEPTGHAIGHSVERSIEFFAEVIEGTYRP